MPVQAIPELARKRCGNRRTATDLIPVETTIKLQAYSSILNNTAMLMRDPSFLVSDLPCSIS